MRIALVCEKGCAVTKIADDRYELAGIDSALTIPLQGRSALLQGLKFDAVSGASLMSLDTDRTVSIATVGECVVRDTTATCIDLQFAPETMARVETPPPAEEAAPAKTIVADAAPSSETMRAAEPAPKTPAVEAPPPEPAPQPALRTARQETQTRPKLRAAPNRDILTFERFAAPERLSPPKLAVITPVSAGATPDAEVSALPKKIVQPVVSMRKQVSSILGKSYGVAECEGAQARLNKDAWALDAMVDVGFCKALTGDLQKADDLFSRLLAYTPDNYHALVGRALIAAENGEIGSARSYFQDALNALPPIKDSDRIVTAMQAL